jgi:hypothetical protein
MDMVGSSIFKVRLPSSFCSLRITFPRKLHYGVLASVSSSVNVTSRALPEKTCVQVVLLNQHTVEQAMVWSGDLPDSSIAT